MKPNAQADRDARDRRMAGLSPGRREILDKLLARRNPASRSAVARARADVSEASFAQERMWILDRLMPGVSFTTRPR